MRVVDMKEPAQYNTEVIKELQSKIQTLENEKRLALLEKGQNQ